MRTRTRNLRLLVIMEKKRFLQAVQVRTNATEMMKLPCVTACIKTVAGKYIYELSPRTLVLSSRGHAIQGDWLVEEHDGFWRCVEREDLNKYYCNEIHQREREEGDTEAAH
jgi:hypothetical protein